MEVGIFDIDKINIDQAYQRQADSQRVNKNAKAFKAGAVKAVSLSRRADGSLWCYDGQHTLATLRQMGDKRVCATVVAGDQEKEAEWFMLMNGSGVRKATARDVQKAGIVAGDAASVEVQALLDRFGLKLAKGGANAGEINSVGTLKALQRQDKESLVDAMEQINSLWRDEPRAWTHPILRGMFDIRKTCGAQFIGRVAKELRSRKITPQRVLDVAGGMQAATGLPGSGSAYAKRAILSLAKLDQPMEME